MSVSIEQIPSRTGIPKKGKKLVVSWVTQINQTLEDINVKIPPSDNLHQVDTLNVITLLVIFTTNQQNVPLTLISCYT